MDPRVELRRQGHLVLVGGIAAADALLEGRQFGRRGGEMLHLGFGHLAACTEHAQDLPCGAVG